MRALVFETPGLLDLRALTLMGVSAKPGTEHPIGMFGTGLKYAVAVLCRLGAPPIVWVGRNRYDFRVREDEFRGSTIGAIDMVGLIDRRELPYTTEYGRFWEPWMVYRELESNTVDEGGVTYITEDLSQGVMGCSLAWTHDEFTRVVVIHPDVVAQHERRGEVFLPDLGEPVVETRDIRAWARPPLAAWYRGLKVHDLGKKPSIMTYDLKQAALTEDRTLRSMFQLRSAIPGAIIRLEDEALIYQLLTAGEGALEGDLDWDYLYEEPTEAFRRAYERAKSKVSRSVRNYRDRVFPEPVAAPPDPFARWPRPWRREVNSIVDDNGNYVPITHNCLTEADYVEWGECADAVIKAINDAAPRGKIMPF